MTKTPVIAMDRGIAIFDIYAGLLRLGYTPIGAMRAMRAVGISLKDAKDAADRYGVDLTKVLSISAEARSRLTRKSDCEYHKHMSAHTIRIEDGNLSFVYSDDLADLMTMGTATVHRVSHVEYANDIGGWTADMGPVNGPVLGPFATREAGLAAERAWLAAERGL